jgi:2-dehydropantoate 2-reductase
VTAPSGERIAVVGVGAIGGSVAADLADLARHEITLCARTAFDRLVVEHPAGVSHAQARVVTEPDDVAPVSWVLLATKAYQCAEAKPWLDALCDNATRVAVLQNGVDHVERVGPLVPTGVGVLPVVIQLPAEKIAAGRVVQAHAGMLLVPDDETGRAFAQLFAGGRTHVKPTTDFITQAWWKLVSNASLGGICALALRGNEVATDDRVRELCTALMREVVEVGRAEGAQLPLDAPEKALKMLLGGAPDHWSSIAVDRREGRPMEWAVRNDVVCRRGRRHRIPTPLNDAITTLLRAADVEPSPAQ